MNINKHFDLLLTSKNILRIQAAHSLELTLNSEYLILHWHSNGFTYVIQIPLFHLQNKIDAVARKILFEGEIEKVWAKIDLHSNCY